jgi:hypothetical protein
MFQLTYDEALHAWTFLEHGHIVSMGDMGRIFAERRDALYAAALCGLYVNARGQVKPS